MYVALAKPYLVPYMNYYEWDQQLKKVEWNKYVEGKKKYHSYNDYTF